MFKNELPRLAHRIRTRALTISVTVLLLVLAVMGVGSATAPAAPEDGYWQQTAVDTMAFEWTETSSYSLNDGSATYTQTSPGTGDVFRSQATWTSPKASYRGGETVELTLKLEITEYVRNAKDDGYIHVGLNSVGDDIYARIDAPGMSPGSSTGGRIVLADRSGEYMFGVRGSDGQKVVPSAGATVTAVFPAGYASGEERAIYVTTKSGAARYTYTWVSGDDPTATSVTGGPTETTEVVVYDSRVRFKDLKGQIEVCHPVGYTSDGVPIWDSPKKWERADRNTRVLVGTKIRVPFGGSARLEHPYGWKVTLRSETMITVPRIYSEESMLPATGLVETLGFFGLDYGIVKVDIVTTEDTSVAVTMKRAVVRVKGTQFVLAEDEATSIVKVLDGTVEVESLVDGTAELVEFGEMIDVTSDGLGERGTFDVAAEVAEWGTAGNPDEGDGLAGWLIGVIVAVAAVVVGGALMAVLLVKYRRGRQTHAQPPYARAPYPQPPYAGQPGAQQPYAGQPRPPQSTQALFCRQCGAASRPGAAFCEKCGARLGE